MDWLILALLGTVFFSVAGVLDKLLLSGYTDDSKAYIPHFALTLKSIIFFAVLPK